ncbi:MAG: PilZ domain-containing protein [Alphaproteobacteria bacterium]|nr:PilZ domain-containing protein [Alphaproteobacteria bacterium]
MAKKTVEQTAPDIKPVAEDQAQGEDSRQFKRRSVLWPAKLRVGKHELSCQIWNLSLGGARVRVDLPLQEGVEIELSLSGRGDIPATVVWAKGELLGVAFEVGPEVIRRMFEDRLHVLGLADSD